ncbi:hypothetical protein [Leclercia tamurae]|uniref:hypothetical protein n=1 Tax=Leclercia tamurae TaxID=2926467 RepID=UPI0036F462D0
MSEFTFEDLEEVISQAENSLVQMLALQLRNQIKSNGEITTKCAALAAENVALKSAVQTHSESVHFCELCGKDDPCSTDDVCMALSETPDTDAFLAEVRAQGVEMFAKEMHADISEADAIEFAAQLRQDANTAELVAAGIITKVGE